MTTQQLTDYANTLRTLTFHESAALHSAYESSGGNGHDFGFTDEILVPGMNKQQVGGVISSLLQKNIIARDDEFSQFCFGTDWDEGRYQCANLVATKLGLVPRFTFDD